MSLTVAVCVNRESFASRKLCNRLQVCLLEVNFTVRYELIQLDAVFYILYLKNARKNITQ